MQGGIVVYGEKGNIQIDSNYRNLFLRQIVKVSTSNLIGQVYQGTVSLSIDSVPLVAAGCISDVGIAINSVKRTSNNTWSITVNTTKAIDAVIYIFDVIKESSSKYGLCVYDDKNNVVFDALQSPLRVVSAFRDKDQESKVSLPSTSRDYAIAVEASAIKTSITWFTQNNDLEAVVDKITEATIPTLSSNDLLFSSYRMDVSHNIESNSDGYYSDIGGLDFGTTKLSGLLIDVTGY